MLETTAKAEADGRADHQARRAGLCDHDVDVCAARPLTQAVGAAACVIDLIPASSWGLAPHANASSRHLRDVLEAKGYDVVYRDYAAGHDHVAWRGALSDGLLTLFQRKR